MTAYDAVADQYDAHFRRPVDRWEDRRLARLLAPLVNRRMVLDLGCGTGWVADHLNPGFYVGVDASVPMLTHLTEKHPEAIAVKADLWTTTWTGDVLDALPRHLPDWRFATVVSTWAAHDFPLVETLAAARHLVTPGGFIALHGQSPRYEEREHYILAGADEREGWRSWTPARCEAAEPLLPGRRDRGRGLTYLGAFGTGARDGGPWPLWRLTSALTDPGHHFAFLALWRVD